MFHLQKKNKMTPRIYLIAIYVYFLLHSVIHEKQADSMVQHMSAGSPKTESQLVAVPAGTQGYTLGSGRRDRALRRNWICDSYVGILIGLTCN